MNNTLGRRDFLKAISLGAMSLAVPGCFGVSPEPPDESATDKPNIVLILADDLGYGDIGCYDSRTARTPNLDALGAGGMKFTDFHSNGPMCSPTRAALLTGRYQQRAGIETVLGYVRDRKIGMAATEVTFADALKSAGYTTAIFGKWHTGHLPEYGPIRQGFDTFRGLYGGIDYYSHVNRVGRENWWKDEELAPEEGYVTELITAHAERFIERHKDRPFCLYVPHFAVHFPWQGPNDKADFLPGVNNASPQKKYGSRKDRKNAYREMIESLDDSVGRIVDTIRRLGLERKTLVFFTSDNGGHEMVASSGPLAGYKGSLLEGGHRVPAIAYWPGKIRPGAVTNETVMTMDLPGGLKLDGVNLLPLLLAQKRLPGRTLFWRHNKAWAVRKGPWKLLMRGKTKTGYSFVGLFNLDDDIAEQNDLVESKPGMTAALKADLASWEKEVAAGTKWLRK
ncbi:MAG: sulfatase-like hydrolase/transferase [Planctomycetota bacterium]|jgi:arylsulfatase A-like enzyme